MILSCTCKAHDAYCCPTQRGLLAVQEDDRPTSRNFRGLQVIRSAQVAHEAKGKAKIAAMQEFYSTCFLKILTPLQVRHVRR